MKLKIQNQKRNSKAKQIQKSTKKLIIKQTKNSNSWERERERVPEKCEETDWLVNPWKCGQRICENVENKRERERVSEKLFKIKSKG